MDDICITDGNGFDRTLFVSENNITNETVFLHLTDDWGESRHINLDEEGVVKLYSWLGMWIRENVKMEFVG